MPRRPSSADPLWRDSRTGAGLFAQVPNEATRPGRDTRIDFLRGLSLIVIFVDHTTETYRAAGGHAYYLPTLRDVGLCSAAEFFFFLSGYVFALSHCRILDRAGVLMSFGKCYKRAAQIYAANAAIFVAGVAVAMLFSRRPASYMQYSDLWFLRDHPGEAVSRFLSFGYLPVYTDILPLYVLFLAVAPAVLLALRRNPFLALALSASVYIAAGSISWLNLPVTSSSGDHWGLDPFSWQLLFVFGMALGVQRSDHPTFTLQRFRADNATLWIICFLLVAVALLKVGAGVARVAGWSEWLGLHRVLALPGVDITHAGPIRLGYFAMLLFALLTMLPSSAWFERERWPQPVVACGQHSLTIFAVGAVLTQFDALLMYAVVESYAMFFLVILLSVVAILCLGSFLRRHR